TARKTFSLDATLGLGTTDLTLPFHDSTSELEPLFVVYVPTAMQADGPVHETPFNRSSSDAASTVGLGTIDHAEPFHTSISERSRWSVKWCPTAMHATGLLHDTACKMFSLNGSFAVGGTLGLGTIDHTEPFHESINVCGGLVLSTCGP